MTLHATIHGQGPDVVFVHGWGMNGAVWQDLLPDLAVDCRVTVLDLPGHGDSAQATVADLSLWASACLDAAPEHAHWVGWSLGGQVALAAALADPGRFSGLTLLATTPRFVEGPDWPTAMAAETFDGFAAALKSDPGKTLSRFLSLQMRGDDHARATLKRLRAELASRPLPSADGLAQGLSLLRDVDLRGELGALDALGLDVHWLLGERDTLVPAAIAGALTEQMPGARVSLIAGAAHAPHLSHGPQVIAALHQDVLTDRNLKGQDG